MAVSLLLVDGVEVSALRFRQGQAATHGGGSGRRLGGRSGFRVDTPESVFSATTTNWYLGPCAAMIDPAAATHQGVYGWSSDSIITGAVTAADATYPRKDIVYIQVDDSSSGDGSGGLSATVKYAEGVPGPSPVAPGLSAGSGRERSFLVGTITVPQSGAGVPTTQLNTARYAAAGAALPVYSEAERDAVPDKFDGLIVQRRDLPGRPNQVWGGSSWHGQVWTSYTPSWDGWVNRGSGYQSTGSYMMIGPNLCKVRMKLKAGSSPSMGAGNLAVTLPFTSASDQASTGVVSWYATGLFGAYREVRLLNPPSNIQASLVSMPGGNGQGVSPGTAGFTFTDTTELHATIIYRTA